MKAVVCVPGGTEVAEVKDPSPADDQVVVAVEACGLCGSDVHAIALGLTWAGQILGHEFGGRVVEVGSSVSGRRIGQTVAVNPLGSCGSCRACARRVPFHCAAVPNVGITAPGAYAQYVAVPERQLVRLPDDLPVEMGAHAEPLAVALHAVHRAGDLRGRDVVVNGAGPIGSLVVAAARYRGAATVVAADIADSSLAVARALGADETRNLAAGDTLPEDAELVFEASGAPAALGGVLRATARGGTVVQVGNLPGTAVPAVLGDLVTREISWIGAYRFVEEISDALQAMCDGLDVSPLITHRFDLDRAAEAPAVAADRTSGSSKVMLRLGPDGATR
jgi:L-idonate 5-dehydrogenase